MNNTPRKGTLPIVVLRDTVLFPRVGQQLDIVRPLAVKAVRCAVDTGQDICIVMQKNPAVDEPEADDLHMYGIIASVRQVFKHPSSGTMRIRVECICRATVSCVEKKDGMLTGYAAECAETTSDSEAQSKADRRLLKNIVKEYVHRSEHKQARVIMDSFDSLDDLGALTDFLAHTLTLNGEQKQILLSTLEHHKRCERMMAFINDELSIFRLQNEIEQKVQANMDRNQREYYLREQMKVIAEELGDGDSPLQDADMYREKISAINASDEVKDQLFKSCDKLAKLPSGSHEASVERNYLDACLALPWGKLTKDKLNVAQAAKKLDKDHYGMKKVKDRILEFIAVRALAPDIKGQIICLAGPPGVGKTSIARSVAEALGKKYCRVALGGIHDEADIRGHRKTYIGSMPGRIANALKLAGTCNPLILLDEVDKLASDFRGDPTSALLEVLDPEQNSTFHDHYIDLPIDLSNVMFITTANDYGRIPAPLLDRMEVIELPSYTLEEKLNIAKRHLVKKQLSRHGLSAKQLRITDKALTALIDGYTREAGVRSLEREIASVCRKVAKKIALGETDKVSVSEDMLEELLGPVKYVRDKLDKSLEAGIANGLAWTSVGGTMLEIEVAVLEGSGKIELTGSLGDVMQESARTAISYIRSRASDWGIDPTFYKTKDIHIHFPEGATPKDGPSAGITIATAMVSALTGIPVRADVAMTGEITLRGRVLTIGGLREKSMAAYVAGIKTVIIPEGNKADISELSDVVRENIEFVIASKLDTVIECALTALPERVENSITDTKNKQDVVYVPECGGKNETGKSLI